MAINQEISHEIKFGAEDFANVLQWHSQSYPLMQPQDWGKLWYQSCFGPEHLLGAADEQWVYERLAAEWQNNISNIDNIEDIDRNAAGSWRSDPLAGGLRRLHLPLAAEFDETACRLLARLFCRTGAEFAPAAPEVVARRREQLGEISGVGDWLAAWEQAGGPAPSHSEVYRQAYQPHYRLLRQDWAAFFGALAAAAKLLAEDKPGVVVIDGRCGSGKTSLGQQLAEVFGADLVRQVHIDDYYLPLAQRRQDWQQIPGANLDKLRFEQEVLLPLQAGKTICSRAYDCQRGDLGAQRVLEPAALTVIEGSYSMLLTAGAMVDLRIFVECEHSEQERRLRAREGEYFGAFERLWLPLEEKYFAEYGVAERCEMRIVTG